MTTPAHILLTGATSGIGRAVADALATRGASLDIVGRSRDALATRASELARLGAAAVDIHVANLASAGQVVTLAQRLAERPAHTGVALLAGVISPRRLDGPDGVETHYAVNHLNKAILSAHLHEAWAAAGTTVLIGAPVGRVKGAIAADAQRQRWSMMRAVSASQHANDLLALHLSVLHRDARLAIVAWNPGPTRGTGLAANLSPIPRALMRASMLAARRLDEVGEQGARLLIESAPGLAWVRGRGAVGAPGTDQWAARARQVWEYDAGLVSEALGRG